MKKTEICKRIIRSITSYIDSPDCLEAHRSHNHFIRKRKLSFKQVVMYLLYSSKASPLFSMILAKMHSLLYQSRLYQKQEAAFFHLYFRNSSIFQLISFIKTQVKEKPGMAIMYLPQMDQSFSSQIQKAISMSFLRCSVLTIMRKSSLWPFHPWSTMSLMTI